MKPLTLDMVYAMADVMKEGFGSKRCCACVPIGNTNEIYKFFQKHPERLERTGLAIGKDGKPLGFVQIAIYPQHDKDGLHTNKPGETYVGMVGVAAAARGKGVRKMLLQWAEDQARANNGTTLSLTVLNGNPARRLYERFGFVEVPTDECEQCITACVITIIAGRPYGCCDQHCGGVDMTKRLV